MGPDRIRFFASGEYGERTHRPHYHAILFGVGAHHGETIEQTWQLGHTHTVPVTPAAIAYVAGYCSKKIGWRLTTQVDPATGEVLYEPPFREMSRRPGIGAAAKQWPEAWRTYGIHQGKKVPVPRYLHNAWKQQATGNDIDELEHERATERQNKALRETLTTQEETHRLRAAEALAVAKQNLAAAKRKY